MTKNWWKLLITDSEGKCRFMRIESVEDAVVKAKELRKRGSQVELVSGKHGYKPNRKAGPRPTAKHYWCPYCVKWRVFVFSAVRVKGLLGPEDMRCPVCLVSDHDYYVRRYNGQFEGVDLELLYRQEGAMHW